MVRRIRLRPRTAMVAVAAVAAVAAAGTALATTAGAPGTWTVIARGSGVPSDSASDLGLARTPDGALHVAWKERTGALTQAIRQRAISPAGGVGAATTIVAGWTSLSDPELVAGGSGALQVFFGGQHSTSTSDPLAGLVDGNLPTGGATWSGSRRRAPAQPSCRAHAVRDRGGWDGIPDLVRRKRDLRPPRARRRSGGPAFTAAPALNEFGPTIVDDAAGRLWLSWCGFGPGRGRAVPPAGGSGARALRPASREAARLDDDTGAPRSRRATSSARRAPYADGRTRRGRGLRRRSGRLSDAVAGARVAHRPVGRRFRRARSWSAQGQRVRPLDARAGRGARRPDLGRLARASPRRGRRSRPAARTARERRGASRCGFERRVDGCSAR